MRIIFIGAPGTGKGTQAQWITNQYNIPKISTGDILRNTVLDNTELSKKIKKFINYGKLVDDNIIIRLIKKRMEEKDCHQGFLLDGFPRTVVQANELKKNKIKIDYVIEFLLQDELILKRIQGRRIHTKSGRIYHITYNPPKIENYDDVTGEKLVTREDDTQEKIKKRIQEYKIFTVPLIQYYKYESILGNVKYYKIDANATALKIKNNIKNILKNSY
ncbi:adenylate kinase [Buchnera aphidicola]|uniref:adenylate kinase n=1 Tax=Buchnera aphidicola TaxID=9 RepID=UPI0034645BB0